MTLRRVSGHPQGTDLAKQTTRLGTYLSGQVAGLSAMALAVVQSPFTVWPQPGMSSLAGLRHLANQYRTGRHEARKLKTILKMFLQNDECRDQTVHLNRKLRVGELSSVHKYIHEVWGRTERTRTMPFRVMYNFIMEEVSTTQERRSVPNTK